MYNLFDIFKQCAGLPHIFRIAVSKCILYILIGSFSLALVPTLEGASFYGGVGADSSLSENVNEARCRGSCLIKYTLRTSPRDDTCKKSADCYMCWSICHLLLGDSPARSSLCSDRAACFPGCQTACRFYEFLPSQNLTPPLLHDLPPLPAHMSPPILNRDGLLVWDKPKWPEGSYGPSEEDAKIPRDQSWGESEAASHDSNQFSTGNRLSFPDEAFIENASSKYWNVVVKKRGKEDLDSLVNSQKIKNSGSSTDEVQSSSLLVWAACLGVGAVIISILIAMAIRTLKRNNSSKRQEICPNEDYLSETTTSSVNSSSITTTSQLTRGSQSSRPEEEQWNYESVFRGSNQPTSKILIHRHPPPPPPIPLSSPPLTPIHLHHPLTPHYRHNHNIYHPYHHHGHPAQLNAAPARIDHASMIENYILSLDPSPVVKHVAY